MEKFHPYFPLSLKVQSKDTRSLVVSILLYIACCLVMSIVGKLIGWIPLVGFVVHVVSWLLDIYCLAGIVLSILRYVKE